MLNNVGVSLLNTGDLTMEGIIQYVQEAEALGYEGFWVGEGDGKETFAVLAAVAAQTKRISLGTGDVNFYSRTPTLLAMGAATISRMSSGRFLHYGIGTGGGGWMEASHGVALDRPVRRARETIEIIRALLNPQNENGNAAVTTSVPSDAVQGAHTNQRLTYRGEVYKLFSLCLREGPLEGFTPPRIYLSALGPKMIALSARMADGVISNGLSEASYYRYREIFEREAPAVGRNPDDVKLYTLTMTTADDSNESLKSLRICLTYFFGATHFYPVMEASGYGPQAKELSEIWRAEGIIAASRVVTDEMMAKFAVIGSPEERRKRLLWMLDHDVYPIIYPVFRPGQAKEDIYATIRNVAEYLKQPAAANATEASPV